MKRMFSIFLCLTIVNTSYAQTFFENFNIVSPSYGTNVTNCTVGSGTTICPSISFRTLCYGQTGSNTNIDCLNNWKTAAGTPSISSCNSSSSSREIEAVPLLCDGNAIRMYVVKPHLENAKGEAIYLDTYTFNQYTNYQLSFSLKSFGHGVTDATFRVLLSNSITPYYYGNIGAQCASDLPNGQGPIILDIPLPANGSAWKRYSVNFSVSGVYNQLAFFPNTNQFSTSTIETRLDNVRIENLGACITNDVFIQNNSIYPSNTQLGSFNNTTISGRNIFAGNNVTSNASIGNVVFASGTNIHLQGTNTVLITDGFYAEPNSNFSASIDGVTCDPAFRVLQGDYTSISYNQEEYKPIEDNLESIKNASIQVNPNPSNGIFSISSSQKHELIKEVTIHDKYGIKAFEYQNSKNLDIILVDITKHKKGLYFIRFRIRDMWYNEKIVIE